jgi:hypothetical protein
MNASEITRLIQEFAAESPTNSLKNAENEKAWDEPLVGFSRGDDPLYQKYAEIHFGFHGYGCGFCQTGVPCESRIPVRK